MDYLKYIIFEKFDTFTVKRKPENGGNKTYSEYKDLEEDFIAGNLHPGDLKPAVAQAINQMI